MKGENYDARKEVLSDFHNVRIENFSNDNLICVDTVHMLPNEEFEAKLIESPSGEKIIDFGQNLVGYIELSFDGKEDEKIVLTHGETLDQNGNFTIANFQNPKVTTHQQIIYTCKNGKNSYHPTKTYMGFRYVKIEGDVNLLPSNVKAHAIYSDMRVTSKFECNMPEINKLFENAIWSMKGNFLDIPTDCPTREKSGFSGDCQAFIHTAMYLMDCFSVYSKWLSEQAAGQYPDGNIPQISPKACKPEEHDILFGKTFMDGCIGWADSIEIVPYRLAKRYGDTSVIENNYEVIKKWTEYEIKRAKRTRFTNKFRLKREYREFMIDTGWMWGEWLEPYQDATKYVQNLIIHGDAEVGTAFFYLNLCYVRDMAKLLNKDDDAKYFDNLSRKVKEAYRATYTENGKILEEKRQCRFVRPIAHDLLSEDEKFEAAKELSTMIKENNNHLNTGFLTTHELCRVLSNYGQTETAYDLLLQKEMPSWLHSVCKGLTTIPEAWDFYKEDGSPRDSYNHYSYGAIAGWLMDSVAGIKINEGKITIEPHTDKRIGYVKASYDSPYGKIISNWEYEGEKINYHIVIPTNMEAEIAIENMERKTLKTGEYVFYC